MTIRFLAILAFLATLGTLSTPSFASEDEMAAPSNEAVEAVTPIRPPRRCEPWMRNCRVQPPLRRFVCYSRNITGRTFMAYGDWRMPRYFVQNRALQICRNSSLPFIRATCRPMGCRYFR